MIPVWASLSSDSPTPTRAQVLHDPLTCTPCGHTFCARCLRTEVGGGGEYKLAVCPECDGPAGKVVSVGMLGTLTAKFEYQKQTLAELKGARSPRAPQASLWDSSRRRSCKQSNHTCRAVKKRWDSVSTFSYLQ